MPPFESGKVTESVSNSSCPYEHFLRFVETDGEGKGE
jgi:hypothetical protein